MQYKAGYCSNGLVCLRGFRVLSLTSFVGSHHVFVPMMIQLYNHLTRQFSLLYKGY